MKLSIDEAVRLRIKELVKEKGISITGLCLNANLTPSTVFDFLYGKSKNPKIVTIKKLCIGAGITLEEFFSRDYFNSDDDVYN